MILVVILLLLVGYYFFRQSGNGGLSPVKTPDAEEILKRRFVSGEIDEETYGRMLQTLRL